MSVTKVSSAMQDLTDDYAFSGTVTGTPGITLGTAVASTSGTAIDFTGIPAGTKRITINFVGVSTNGASFFIAQLGDSGGFETSGYLGASSIVGASAQASTNGTTGFVIYTGDTSLIWHGSMILSLVDSSTFTWSGIHVLGLSESTYVRFGASSKSLSAELTQVRLTAVNGSDTFDAGKVNISYE